MDAQLPPDRNGRRETTLPRVDLSVIRPDYKSDVMNRDVLTGKVNKDGLTVGKVTETAVELAAPVAAGKIATTTAKAPETLKSIGALPNKAAPSQDVSRVYRVQGGTVPRASKHRISIGENGEMVVNKKATEPLFVTFDDIGRVKVYQAKNRPGSEIISFEVDPKVVKEIRAMAVYEKDVRQFPNAPIIADPTKTSSSFGLPPEWIDKLINAAKSGTGRIDK